MLIHPGTTDNNPYIQHQLIIEQYLKDGQVLLPINKNTTILF